MDCVWLVWDRIDTRRGWGLLDPAGPVVAIEPML
jgi:hypothetical protein